MTEVSTAIKVDLYSDELFLIQRALNYVAEYNDEYKEFNNDELVALSWLYDHFTEVLENV